MTITLSLLDLWVGCSSILWVAAGLSALGQARYGRFTAVGLLFMGFSGLALLLWR